MQLFNSKVEDRTSYFSKEFKSAPTRISEQGHHEKSKESTSTSKHH